MTQRHVDDGEQKRIRRVYEGYAADPREIAKRDARNPGLQAIVQERRRLLLELLAAERLLPLAGKRILDVGCGNGDELAWLCEQLPRQLRAVVVRPLDRLRPEFGVEVVEEARLRGLARGEALHPLVRELSLCLTP